MSDGLIFLLDAANSKSYLNGSPSWNDLSRTLTRVDLSNSPSYNSLNSGSLFFDGINEYGETPRLSQLRPSYVTMCAWVKYSGSQPVSFIGGYGNTGTDGYFLSVSSTINKFRFSAGNGNPISGGSPILNIADLNSNINYVCGTFDGTTIKGYLNGNLRSTLNQGVAGPLTYPTTGSSPILGGLYLGSLENNLGVSRYWTGNIYQIQIYNRSLNDSEILQNFNSSRSRFGV